MSMQGSEPAEVRPLLWLSLDTLKGSFKDLFKLHKEAVSTDLALFCWKRQHVILDGDNLFRLDAKYS